VRFKLGELIVAEEALKSLAKATLPIRAAYRVARLARMVAMETQHFHQQRDLWVRELGQEHGGQITVTPDNYTEFQRRLNELANESVDLNIQPLDLSLFGDNFTVACETLVALGPLICSADDFPQSQSVN
jgi:hypothetical protein